MNLINQSALEKLIDEQVTARLAPLMSRIEKLESNEAPEYMTKQQAASYLNCSVSTIDNYVKMGLPKCKITKGKVLFVRSELDDFMSLRKF